MKIIKTIMTALTFALSINAFASEPTTDSAAGQSRHYIRNPHIP